MLSLFAWAALVPVAVLLVVRVLGLDGGSVLALPVAGFPLVAAGTTVLAALFGILRLRAGWVALGLVLVQAVVLLPRFVADGADVPSAAPRIRVATVNALKGRVDPSALMEVVRRERVDVLAVQELPEAGVRALREAGLEAELPHVEPHPEVDTSLYSRLPLREGGLLDAPTTWPQTTAKVEVAGRSLTLVGVHTYYPAGNPGRWGQDMAALRSVAGRDVVVLGDFNATLDHSAMRELLAAGLADAHDELGIGWAPTWPADGVLPPLVQLDHVLHGSGLAPVSARTEQLPRTDHRMVVAELALLP